MKIDIQSPDFTAGSALVNFVTNKVEKLSHFNNKLQHAHVCLRLEKSDKQANKVCEIRLFMPGNDLFASRQAETFEQATAEVADALRHQIEKIP